MKILTIANRGSIMSDGVTVTIITQEQFLDMMGSREETSGTDTEPGGMNERNEVVASKQYGVVSKQ